MLRRRRRYGPSLGVNGHCLNHRTPGQIVLDLDRLASSRRGGVHGHVGSVPTTSPHPCPCAAGNWPLCWLARESPMRATSALRYFWLSSPAHTPRLRSGSRSWTTTCQGLSYHWSHIFATRSMRDGYTAATLNAIQLADASASVRDRYDVLMLLHSPSFPVLRIPKCGGFSPGRWPSRSARRICLFPAGCPRPRCVDGPRRVRRRSCPGSRKGCRCSTRTPLTRRNGIAPPTVLITPPG